MLWQEEWIKNSQRKRLIPQPKETLILLNFKTKSELCFYAKKMTFSKGLQFD